MGVKPIKNESEYDAALAEIADPMDARANTPEGDRLAVFVTLVEAYEEKHWRVNLRTGSDRVQFSPELQRRKTTELVVQWTSR
jgi:HTH-type transcriptional regulator/antitoxin HigA